MIDLQPFCSTDPLRPYLQKPFSRGEWTYATNGHVLVRVPKVADIPEGETAAEKVMTNIRPDADVSHLGEFILPEPEEIDCPTCEGRGTEHDCPDCECGCDACDSSGRAWKKNSVSLRGAVFDARYLSFVTALPNLTFQTNCHKTAPSLFKFDGGEGVIMPMRIEPSDANIDAANA